jgi:hypothetical protein
VVDFKARLGKPRRPRFTWHYVCQKCKAPCEFVARMPDHLLGHWLDSLAYPRCRGKFVLVRIVPDDERLVRCPACAEAGRHDPQRGPGWVDPTCSSCGGDGAVPREVSA